MILGELFYFSKTLDQVVFPIDTTKNDLIELMGLTVSIKNYTGMSEMELRRSIRDQFATSYGSVLQNNRLDFASEFWRLLVNPVKSKIKTKPQTDFQIDLLNWLLNDNKPNEVSKILNAGQYSDNETDFALYYGLKVLIKFSSLNPDENSVIDSNELSMFQLDSFKPVFNEHSKPQIIVVTQEYLSPLFVNINCVYVPWFADQSKILSEIDKALIEHTDIKAVFVNTGDHQLVSYLKKYLPQDVLVSDLVFGEQTEGGFFDKITKKTLGIKLTTE